MKIQVRSTKREKPEHLSIGLIGWSGSGKTRVTSTLPGKTLMLAIEEGTEVLRDQEIDAIHYNDLEGEPIDRMRGMIKFCMDNADTYDWVVMDSFSALSSRFKAGYEANPEHYGLLTGNGAFDGRGMYGQLRIVHEKILLAFLALKLNKAVIFLPDEKADGPEARIIPSVHGSYSDDIIAEFDEFWGVIVQGSGDDIKRKLLTTTSDAWHCKSRMAMCSKEKIETFEDLDIAKYIAKCYK